MIEHASILCARMAFSLFSRRSCMRTMPLTVTPREVAMAYRYTCHVHTSTSWSPLNKPRCGMPCPRQYASQKKEKATTKTKSVTYRICNFLSW